MKKKVVATEWITLDGVFDAKTMEEWFMPFHSEERAARISEDIHGCDALLIGRKTYESLAPYWSSLKNNEMGIADKMNSVLKYVVSTTLAIADWNNSAIIRKNIIEEVTRLKKEPGHEILVIGSATLVKTLMEAHLIDEFRMLVHPVIMGNGKHFFTDGMPAEELKLVHSEALDTGVMYLHYQLAKKSTIKN